MNRVHLTYANIKKNKYEKVKKIVGIGLNRLISQCTPSPQFIFNVRLSCFV